MAAQEVTLRPPCHRSVFLLSLALAGVALGCSACSKPPAATVPVVISGKTFHLELAVDAASRYKGLSDRPSIPEDGGMLFVFPAPQKVEFVMRRCLVPIDVIFLDGAGRVDSWHAMAVEPIERPEEELRRYPSRWPVMFAIEVPGHTCRRLNVREGDKVQMPIDELKRMAR